MKEGLLVRIEEGIIYDKEGIRKLLADDEDCLLDDPSIRFTERMSENYGYLKGEK